MISTFRLPLALSLLVALGIVTFFVPPTEACTSAPSKLGAIPAFATEVSLTWKNNTTDTRNLTISRSTDGVTFVTIGSVLPTTSSFSDTKVKPSTTYHYRVSCWNGLNSNVASARTTIALITNPNIVLTEPQVSKPAYRVSTIDSVFHTKITRISNNSGASFTTANNGAGVWARDARHIYQLVQPWNINGSYFMIENREDDGGRNAPFSSSWLYLSGSAYSPALGPDSKEPIHGGDQRWNPNPAYASQLVMADDSNPRLYWFDTVHRMTTRNWTLPFTPEYIGNTKGNVSRDGRFVALIDTTLSKMVVVDMDPQAPYAPYPNKRIGPVHSIQKVVSGVSFDSATVSVDPLGRYVVLHFGTKNGGGGNYMRVYDINPATLQLSVRKMPAGVVQCVGSASDNWIYSLGHHDLAYNPFDNNEPVAIGQEECNNVRKRITGVKTVNTNGVGHVVMVRLRDGAVTSLTDPGNGSGIPYEAYAHHISARNTWPVGWIFVSYGPWPGQQSYRFYDEVIALSMDGKQRVQRLAHLHSDYDDITGKGCSSSDNDFNYRSESHGVPSPDGKRVTFASNWLVKGNGNCTIQDYVIDLR